MDWAISPKSCQELGSLQDLAGHTVPLISVFFVSCCTAVPTKISGSVLMDEAAQYRSNMHGNDPGQLLYQLVCWIYCKRNDWNDSQQFVIHHICSRPKWVGLKMFEAFWSTLKHHLWRTSTALAATTRSLKTTELICQSYQLSSGHLMLTFWSLRRKNIALEVQPPRDWKLLHASAVGACTRLFLMSVDVKSDHVLSISANCQQLLQFVLHLSV